MFPTGGHFIEQRELARRRRDDKQYFVRFHPLSNFSQLRERDRCTTQVRRIGVSAQQIPSLQTTLQTIDFMSINEFKIRHWDSTLMMIDARFFKAGIFQSQTLQVAASQIV